MTYRDIRLSEVVFLDYVNSPFTYSNGTSFAAPIVSGIASLIWSQKPDLHHLWVIEIILASKKDNSLQDLIRSGGPINALLH